MRIAIIVIACFVIAALIGLLIEHFVRRHREIKIRELETGEKFDRRQAAKEWFINHKPSKRRLIQVYAALLYNANIKGFITGNIYKSETTKYMCVPGMNCYSCPGAVGACPLGSFQNALSNSDKRAPFYVLGILGLFGLTLARTICGFLCPVGLGQELLYKIRTPKIKKSRVTRVLSYFKYVLLLVLVIALPLIYAFASGLPLPAFCKYICPAGTFGGALGLLVNPANESLFASLGGQFTWKFALLVLFIVGSVFIYRVFCRFFCPLGAIYGFFNRISLLGVKLERDNCVDCGKCISVCKMDVKHVGDHECINCGECIAVCPTKAISWKGSQIFLHKSAIDTTPTIKAIETSGGAAVIKPVLMQAEAVSQPEVAISDVAVAESPEKVEAVSNSTEVEKGGKTANKRPKRGKQFWVQLAAVITAVAVLIGALVYYNFIDVRKPRPTPGDDVGFSIGQWAPDFTLELYNSEEESFTLYDHLGKYTVINFWSTDCSWCIVEMPDFNELALKHEDITVIALHAIRPAVDINDFIASHGWGDFVMNFGQDEIDEDNYSVYFDWASGGRDGLPHTVILDEEGKVLYNKKYEFKNYEDLENTILSLEEGQN